MHYINSLRRFVLLALTLLSACAASDPTPRVAGTDPAQKPVADTPITGATGKILAGRFAESQNDLNFAADEFLRALASDPRNPDLLQQAFITCLLAGRPEALKLARMQPDVQAAQLLVADSEASSGNWQEAEARYAALPHQGLMQVLQPLVTAWAQQGGGNTDAALATLNPFVESSRFKGIYALHAALIADMAKRTAEAARLYRLAQTDFGTTNLELAREVASWQARQGYPTDATQTLSALADADPEFAIALPALKTDMARIQVHSATDGIAETYLALAAALSSQDTSDFSLVLVQLALRLRPDLTAARLLSADILDGRQHPGAALRILSQVGPDDPLEAVVRVRRAALLDREGQSEEALRLLNQLAKDYPNQADPATMQRDILREKGRFADAVAAYDRAVALVPHPTRVNWPLFYDRGIAEERSHNWSRAEADFEKALELSPEQPFVLNYLGYSWAEQGHNLPKARQMIERALQERPNDGAIVDSLGWVMLREGSVKDAVKNLEHAVELEPEDATINGHLGDAYAAAGRKLEAQYQWRRALNLKPEPDEVPKLQAKLRDGDQASGAGSSGTAPAAAVIQNKAGTLTGPAELATVEAGPAKVNLYLHVTGRRVDGYHLLDSLAVFAAVGDRLHAAPAPALTLALAGPFAAALAEEADNLVLRAARALAVAAGIEPGARLTLTKNLPVASGIGGGSADAAAALRLLARLWNVHVPPAAMREIAVRLGADVPVCLVSAPVRMGGIGELLTPAPKLPECGIALINPGVAVSTQAVFTARTGPFSAPATLPDGWPDVEAMAADLHACGNDLEAPAVALCPPIADALAALRAPFQVAGWRA